MWRYKWFYISRKCKCFVMVFSLVSSITNRQDSVKRVLSRAASPDWLQGRLIVCLSLPQKMKVQIYNIQVNITPPTPNCLPLRVPLSYSEGMRPSKGNSSLANVISIHVLPTPLSPTAVTLIFLGAASTSPAAEGSSAMFCCDLVINFPLLILHEYFPFTTINNYPSMNISPFHTFTDRWDRVRPSVPRQLLWGVVWHCNPGCGGIRDRKTCCEANKPLCTSYRARRRTTHLNMTPSFHQITPASHPYRLPDASRDEYTSCVV